MTRITIRGDLAGLDIEIVIEKPGPVSPGAASTGTVRSCTAPSPGSPLPDLGIGKDDAEQKSCGRLVEADQAGVVADLGARPKSSAGIASGPHDTLPTVLDEPSVIAIREGRVEVAPAVDIPAAMVVIGDQVRAAVANPPAAVEAPVELPLRRPVEEDTLDIPAFLDRRQESAPMGETTEISWTDHTFNPWIGCTKVSAACDHCYAETLAKRYGWAEWGPGEQRKRTREANWLKPIAWNKAAARDGVRRRVFCASLADIFDAEVSDTWRDELFAYVIMATPHLDWLLLTKRPQVALKWFTEHPAPRNVWLGTTVEDQKMADLRIPILLSVPGISVRFLSCEPLLGPVDLGKLPAIALGSRVRALPPIVDRDGTGLHVGPWIDWVIAGGESGRGARPTHPDWLRSLRDQCQAAGVPFHFKQWGEWVPVSEVEGAGPHHRFPDGATARRIGTKAAGARLDGREWREFPHG